MEMLHDLRCFFGAAFLTNAVPHFVAGVMGRPFQSPFAKPPGQGLSSSVVNVAWGFFNLVVAWVLLMRGAGFDPHEIEQVVAAGLGVFLMGMMSAVSFGRFNGGNAPGSP